MCSSAAVYHVISRPSPLINQIGKIRFLQPCQQNRYTWGFVNLSGYLGKKLINGKLKKNAEFQIREKTVSSAETLILNRDTGAITKPQVKDFALKLTSEERELLISTLQECQSMKLKAEYEGI